MRVRILITALVFVFTISLQSQEKKDAKSKMTEFVSKTGAIIKFEEYRLPKLKSSYGGAEVNIRKIISGKLEKYFYQVSKKGEYDTKVASIAYEDLVEVIKAIDELKNQSEEDVNTISDYLENKFVSEDEFVIGYYVSNKRVVWYIQLDKYGSNNTIFLKDVELFSKSCKAGKLKIEELRSL